MYILDATKGVVATIMSQPGDCFYDGKSTATFPLDVHGF